MMRAVPNTKEINGQEEYERQIENASQAVKDPVPDHEDNNEWDLH